MAKPAGVTDKAPSLFIATPTANGVAMTGYVEALAGMLIRLASKGVPVTFRALDGENLILQRNLLVREFLASDATHLLFVDSDLTFPPDLCDRLLATGKPFIGTAYPKRRLDLAALRSGMERSDFQTSLALAYEWNIHLIDGRVTVSGAIAPVRALPGGFLLIAREVFDLLAATGEAPPMVGGADAPRAFFREMRSGDDLIDLDYAICITYARCGGEVWLYLDAEIGHIGDDRTAPPFAALLQAIGPGPRQSQ
jgi:hypothetical protein